MIKGVKKIKLGSGELLLQDAEDGAVRNGIFEIGVAGNDKDFLHQVPLE